MELLDVVDENGNPIGQVIERNKVYDLDLLHLVVSVLVVNNSKQVLIQKRRIISSKMDYYWWINW